MLYPDLAEVPQEVFGGYVSAILPQDLPPGASPNCPDVIFPQGAVKTREGLSDVYGASSPIPANAAINGMKTYLTPTLDKRLMVFDSLGSLYKENPEGTLGLVEARPQAASMFYQSNTIFGREFQAFFTDAGGTDIPRQFDDTFWDRVSQQGPGLSPSAVDSVTAGNIGAGLHQVSCAFVTRQGLITNPSPPIAWTAAGAFQVALTNIPIGPQNVVARLILFTPVITAPATTGSFYSLPTGTTQLATPTVMLISDNATTSTTLDFTDAILIAGFSANYLFTQRYLGECAYTYGYGSRTAWLGERNNLQNLLNTSFDGGFTTTAPTPAASGPLNCGAGADDGGINTPWTNPNNIAIAAGVATASNIPVGGVSNFLRATGFLFAIPSNATIVGITASIKRKRSVASGCADNAVYLLRAGVQAGTNHALGANYSSAGFVAGAYGSSVDAWGESWTPADINDPNFGIEISSANTGGTFTGSPSIEAFITITVNYTTPAAGTRSPLGWTATASYAGGDSAVATGHPVDWGDALVIGGNGATATRGKITQSAYQDYLLVPIIARNTAYRVRARIRRSAGLVAGTIHVNLNSVTGAFTTAGIALDASQVTEEYVEYDALLTSAITTPPADLLLQVYADGTPTNNEYFLIDSIEPYPTTSPYNYSTAFFSHAFNPESIDNLLDRVQVRPNDGQQLRAGFPIRGSFYLAKDHYLCYVVDDGANEPSSWQVTEVSATIGICGPNAVDWTEEWAVFAERSGLYIFWGGDPVKISDELQDDATESGRICWDSINWSAGHTVWVRIDRNKKRIYVGAPIGESSTPNKVFMLDYSWLSTPQEIADGALVAYSSTSGKLVAKGKSRKWSPWSVRASCMTFAERNNGSVSPFLGNAVANGKIYELLDATVQASDDGASINGHWDSYYCPSHSEEQAYGLSALRKILGYLTFRAAGVGSLLLSVQAANRVTNLRNRTLSTNPTGDLNVPLNLHGERFSISFGTDAVGSWFQLEKFIPFLRKDAAVPVRGR